jgi:hypothetical protein
LHFQLTNITELANGIWNNKNSTGNKINVGGDCDQLLQQFHRFDEELSVQGKWQGGTVTGVCKGWGTNKVCIMTADHAICIF